jgi:hypothetical protein
MYRLHHRSEGENQARNPAETGFASCQLHADFLLGLFFDPEDAGDMFFRNIV